ncbi:uncharacterized protein N7529_007081 [Penicillium soppii]|jgi:hypothetical protein|uniref:uncharacterized protein n=1 Tax=Penicillium soppii TaxID=69789 RepID=UPI002549368D|nr:uncharacterized protein N7529_007081 [Penicillium soppii]KAJ5865165.1 hypothetical protein N7529_007081 [Penicillium soppii]
MMKSLKSTQSWSAKKNKGASAGSLQERLTMHAPRKPAHDISQSEQKFFTQEEVEGEEWETPRNDGSMGNEPTGVCPART